MIRCCKLVIKFLILNYKKLVPILLTLIFIALLLKNPFSSRNLISNLEPYPDTIHYTNGALSLIHGYGITLTREGRSIPTAVPPLYSIILVPLYIINNDPRVFYFTNIILSLVSLLMFYKILRKLNINIWV